MNKLIGIVALSISLFGIGCATTAHGSGYSDAEVELAQRQAEQETLARLAASNVSDIADSASQIARERATE